MSRKRKRPSHRRRGVDRVVDPVDVQIREVGSDALEEFFRFGGPSSFACGCSANDAVQISLKEVGSAGYPIDIGLERADIEEFRKAMSDDFVLWWHDCPDNESVKADHVDSEIPVTRPDRTVAPTPARDQVNLPGFHAASPKARPRKKLSAASNASSPASSTVPSEPTPPPSPPALDIYRNVQGRFTLFGKEQWTVDKARLLVEGLQELWEAGG